jgi:hypothetical protein
MAAANVLITYEGDASTLRTTVDSINQINDEIVKSAADTSKKVGEEYKKAAKTATAAFASSQVKNAFDNLNKEANELTIQLKKLEDEQLALLASGNRLSKAYKDNAAAQSQVKSSLNEVNRELERFKTQTEQTESKQKSLTGQLRALKQELSLLEQQGKENTAEFEQLLFTSARLEDQIGDTRERVRVLASDTFKFDAAVGAVQGLTAGFEIAQGAAALFGDENKDLQEIINKTTAVTAIANGVQQLAGIVTGQSAVKLGILSAAKSVYTFATTGATAATRAFRAALVTTGIGALVVALGFLIEKLISTEDQTDDTAEALKRLDAANRQTATSAAAAANQRAISEAKLEGVLKNKNKTEVDALVRKLETDGKVIAAEDEKTNRLLEAQDRYLEEFKKIEANADADDRTKAGLKIIAIEARDKQIADITQETADKIATINADARTAEIEADKDAAKEAAEKRKEAAEKSNEAAKKLAQDRLKIVEESIRLDLLNEDEAVKEKIALAENLAAQAELDAKQNISNVQLRAATIKRIEAQLAKDKEQILIDEQKRIIDNEIQRLQNLQSAGQIEIEQAKELAAKKAELAKQDAALLTDPVARANAEKAAEIELQNELKKIKFDAIKSESELEVAKLTLLQKRGDFTLATEEAIANEQFDLRAAELQREADQTTEGQAKLTVELEALEQDRQKRLSEIRANAAIKALEIDNLRIQTLQVLEQDTLNDRVKFIENEAEIKRKSIEKELISEEEKDAKLKLLNAQTQKEIREERKKTRDEQIKDVLDVAQELERVFSGFADIAKERSNLAIQQFEEQASKELETINASIQLETDKQRQREALELRTNRKIAAEKLKQAKLDKALAAFNVVINTASYIIRLGEQLGIAAPPFQIAAGLLGAAQLATIAAQPLPKFKKGGIIGGKSHEQGGTIIEAERGEFIMNRNSTAKHRKALEAMNNSSAAFKKYIEDKYVKPSLMEFAYKSKDKGIIVNASLNSKSMEKKLDRLNKSMKNNKVIVNINGNDSRYQWHNN